MSSHQLNADQARVALLIDVDNIPEQCSSDLFEKAAVYGNIVVRKGYGAFVSASGMKWKKETLHKYAIEPIIRFVYVSGKNVADIALVIDAMDMAHRKIVDTVCIASNDSDFSLLAMKLRENDIRVYGFGDDKASKAFVSSCDKFIRIRTTDIIPIPNTEVASPDSPDIRQNSDQATNIFTEDITQIKGIIFAACDEYGDDNGFALLSSVGKYLKRIRPDFSPQNYGYEKLLSLVEGTDGFEVTREPPDYHPKIKRKEG